MKDKNVLIMGALDGSVAGQSPRQLGSPRIHVGSRGPPRACGCQPGASLIAARSCPGIVLNIARAGLNLRLGFCRLRDRFSIAGAYRPRVHTGLRVHSALRVRTARCCGSRLASKPAAGGQTGSSIGCWALRAASVLFAGPRDVVDERHTGPIGDLRVELRDELGPLGGASRQLSCRNLLDRYSWGLHVTTHSIG
jgi:hypothetical protein